MPRKAINLDADDLDISTNTDIDDDDDFDLDGGADVDMDAEAPDHMAGVKYTGKLDPDAVNEAEAVMSAFQKRAAVEQQRFIEATDSEFWLALCFQTREQKEEFLRVFNLLKLGDKYLDGRKVARKLGKELSTANVSYRPGKVDPKFASRARDYTKGKGR